LLRPVAVSLAMVAADWLAKVIPILTLRTTTGAH
jgi:hypothetical protein